MTEALDIIRKMRRFVAGAQNFSETARREMLAECDDFLAAHNQKETAQ